MATKKTKRSRSRNKADSRRGMLRFPEVKGKIVELVDVSATQHDCPIGILFRDRTYLAFDLDPLIRITPDFSDWKTQNYKPLKRWRAIQSD